MDVIESEEHTRLRDVVAKLAARHAADFAARARTGEPVEDLWRDLGRGGFLGVHLPEEDGGGGGGLVELAIVAEELAAGGCPLFTLVVSAGMAASIIHAAGDRDQRRRWLPALATGEARLAFALTEADAGSNLGRLSTTATPLPGGGWRLRGQKCFISGIEGADAVVVVARTGDAEPAGRPALSLLLVSPDAPGVSRSPVPMAVPFPERQWIVHLDDVELGPDALLGAAGAGLAVVFSAGLNPERILIAATAVGLGRLAITRAADYARERVVWDVPIGAHQAVAHPLAQSWIEIEVARLAALRAAWLHDRGLPAGEAANVAKFAATEAAVAAADRALQAHGGNGFTVEYGMTELLLVARTMQTVPVSREMVLNFVAQHALGLPRSY
jgi:hypothetical protein